MRARPAGSGKDFPRILLEYGHPVTNAGEGRGGLRVGSIGFKNDDVTIFWEIG